MGVGSRPARPRLARLPGLHSEHPPKHKVFRPRKVASTMGGTGNGAAPNGGPTWLRDPLALCVCVCVCVCGLFAVPVVLLPGLAGGPWAGGPPAGSRLP
eukprot:13272387-Alexandrium_andersonii.AAC.1